MKILSLVPEVLIEYICNYLCLCQICFKHNYEAESFSCKECKRNWCNNCKPLNRILKHVYDHSEQKKVYICAWCIREKKEIITNI